MSENTTPIDIAALSDEQAEILNDLVHDTASCTASNAINSGEQIEYLLTNGFDDDTIRTRLNKS